MDGEGLYCADPMADSQGPGSEPPRRRVGASREVILAGGAFNTPQLLQLSGVGPRELLERHGIPLHVDLPSVGANLQDRYEVTLVQRMKKPFSTLEGARMRPPKPGDSPPDPHFVEWQKGKGIYTTNGAVLSFVMCSSVAGGPGAASAPPDLFVFGLVTDFRGYYPGYSERVRDSHQYFTWAILKGHTHNKAGRVATRSADPRDPPDINFHYFEEGSDTDGEDLAAVEVRFVRTMAERCGSVIKTEEFPGREVRGREQIGDWIRSEAWGHHASCSCKIGADDDSEAVLDSRFRVRGTHNLRVVEASVFPDIPGLFLVAGVYMVAEKAADVILADAREAPA
jgi:choline dehydrogenase